MVKLSNTKDGTDLYRLICEIARGEYKIDTQDSSSLAHAEARISSEFDKFAQRMFDEGVKYQRETSK